MIWFVCISNGIVLLVFVCQAIYERGATKRWNEITKGWKDEP